MRQFLYGLAIVLNIIFEWFVISLWFNEPPRRSDDYLIASFLALLPVISLLALIVPLKSEKMKSFLELKWKLLVKVILVLIVLIFIIAAYEPGFRFGSR